MKRERTIRLLWAGAEEVGIWGGKAYAEANKTVPHALAMESDFGADRVWRVDFKLPDSAKPLADRIAQNWLHWASPAARMQPAAGPMSARSSPRKIWASSTCNRMAAAISICTTRPTIPSA
jgi:hypothetical protein